MWKTLRNIFLISVSAIFSIPITYLVVSILFSSISTNNMSNNTDEDQFFYLNTNGVHLDIILKNVDVSPSLIKDLEIHKNTEYISFAWGDENFFLNTQEWEDLTFYSASNALFIKSPALIHLTKYRYKKEKWIKVHVSDDQMKTLNLYLEESFFLNENKRKVCLQGRGYYSNDDFFKAQGSYTMYYTCNTWVNNAFKECGLKSCLWTPFDFPLIRKHSN